MDKLFRTEQDHLLDGFRLGRQVFESGWRPTFVAGLWRGGAIVGMLVQECLASLGLETEHIALCPADAGLDEQEPTIRVDGSRFLARHVRASDRLLIVDDVFATGRHVHAVIGALRALLQDDMPAEVRVAAAWHRPSPPAGETPDFFVHSTDRWVVMPWEMQGLSAAELAQHKPFLLPLLSRCGIG